MDYYFNQNEECSDISGNKTSINNQPGFAGDKVIFEVLDSECEPKFSTEGAAGFDLRAKVDVILSQGKSVKVPAGVKVNIPKGHVGLVCSRSGLAAEKQVFVLNAPGVVDADFRGEIHVILSRQIDIDFLETVTGVARSSADDVYIKKGDKIAQLVVMPLSSLPFVAGRVDNDTDRGEGGFGSTGNN